MRKIFAFCLLVVSLTGYGQGNDTTKYFKPADYGLNYQRLKTRLAFVPPSDTVGNKLGLVVLNGVIYTGNGSYWTGVSVSGKLNISDTAAMLSSYTRKVGLLNNRRIPFVNNLGQLKDTTGFTFEGSTGQLNVAGGIYSSDGDISIGASGKGFYGGLVDIFDNTAGIVGSFWNNNASGIGVAMRGGSSIQKYTLKIVGYSSLADSIANFNPLGAYFYKPIYGTIATAAQPNITSLGTLTGLASSGAISATSAILSERSAGNVNFLAQMTTSAANDSSQIILSRSGSGAYNLASIDTRQETANASTGSLSINTYDGGGKQRGIMFDRATTATIYRDLTVTGPVTATIATAAQPNITSLGTQTALTVTGRARIGTTVFQLGANETITGYNNNTSFAVSAVNTAGAASAAIGVWNQGTSGDNKFIDFYSDGSPSLRGSITYNRGGGLVAYNTTSDRRSKTILGTYSNSLAVLDSIKIYKAIMKGATVERPMVIADELQKIAPYAVTGEKNAVDKDGKPIYQQVDYQSLIPLLITSIQELKKENDNKQLQIDKLRYQLEEIKVILLKNNIK